MKKITKKSKKHLNFYRNTIKEGYMPYSGLCVVANRKNISGKLLEKFEPTNEDRIQLFEEGKNRTYWGSDSTLCRRGVFTPLRQNIVLFMAAMNGEL